MMEQKLMSGRRQLVLIVTMVAMVIAGAFLLWRLRASSDRAIDGRAWFTIDAGKTWFPDSATKLSPFEHRGKLAYRCYVFTCDGGKTMFVSHLERHPPDVRKRSGKDAPLDPMRTVFVEVKDPLTGDTGWTPATNPKASAITAPRCPDNADRMGEPVLP